MPGSVVGFVSETGEVDGAGGAEGFLGVPIGDPVSRTASSEPPGACPGCLFCIDPFDGSGQCVILFYPAGG